VRVGVLVAVSVGVVVGVRVGVADGPIAEHVFGVADPQTFVGLPGQASFESWTPVNTPHDIVAQSASLQLPVVMVTHPKMSPPTPLPHWQHLSARAGVAANTPSKAPTTSQLVANLANRSII